MSTEHDVNGGGIFSQLMPLLVERAVMITLSRADENTICGNIVPKSLKSGEDAALTTPLSFMGTPQELDREFVKLLSGYVASHETLSDTLSQVQQEMEDAAKRAREEARKRSQKGKSKAEKESTRRTLSTSEPEISAPPAPTTRSLFDTATQPEAAATSRASASSEGAGGGEGGKV